MKKEFVNTLMEKYSFFYRDPEKKGYKKDPTQVIAEEEQIGGRGIFLVKKLMSEVTYCYENGYNELTVKLQRM